MNGQHFEFLVEEPSMEAFLTELIPKLIKDGSSFLIHSHQGKGDLLKKLPSRLLGYSKWLPHNARIVVLIDRDDDDCSQLKQKLEKSAAAAGLATRTITGDPGWKVLNRVAVEELEAWFFGDWSAVYCEPTRGRLPR